MSVNERWVVCLKHGTKYSAEYVNILYSMVTRHSTKPFKFACITENPTGLDSNILHVPLPYYKLTGWWFKPWVFSAEFPLVGDIMFMDLDIVIIDNIDELWEYEPTKFCIIKDFVKAFIPTYSKFNSSVFRFKSHEYNWVWDKIANDLSLTKQYQGDQDYITEEIKDNYAFWPDDWVKSYKWEIRDKKELISVNNKLNFNTIANIKSDAKILVFHGDPKPHAVLDPLIVNNWNQG